MTTETEMPVKFLPLGAIIQQFTVGGHNVVLGFPRQDHYQHVDHPCFGETLGRIPNRLSGGQIHDLNERSYDLAKNERGTTTLHGGSQGWGKKVWDGPVLVNRHSREATMFTLRSPDGDEGFPGEVEAAVWYTVQHRIRGRDGCQESEEVILDIEYEIRMTGSETDIYETVCAVTNHGYWNLGGGPTVEGTEVTFASDSYLEVDSNQIPTGRISTHNGIEKGKTVAFTRDTPVIDDCFVLHTNPSCVPFDTRNQPLRNFFTMRHPSTGLHLEASTTEPSFQFYTGDGIDVSGIPAGDGVTDPVPRRGPRSGIALEPNRYVNAANRPEWRPMVLLRRGEVWGSRSRYRVWGE